MDSTPKFGLRFLSVQQAQKEVAINESLQTLDCVIAAAIEVPPLNDPPAVPVVGDSYIVADAPTGDWLGQAHCLAAFTSGGWRFVAPTDGQTAFVRSNGTRGLYRDGAWQFGSVVPLPTGGSTVDAEGRAAIGEILSALRLHGLIGS